MHSTSMLSALVAITIFPFSTSAGPMWIPNWYHPNLDGSVSSTNNIVGRDAKAGITAAQLLQIAPKSSTCDGFPECRNADQVYVNINRAFETYKITSPGEMAALISLQAFESAEFKYNKNHFPGRPGQGTAAMLMPNFIAKYAASIPALGDKASGLAPDALLLLVNQWDVYNFGSAAWFLTTQCSPDVRTGLQTGGQAGWERYISSCVGTTVTPDRAAYWTKAVAALGVVGVGPSG
ncbi:MAG: hypothetical protein M1836_001431 [Candelina mexicana]|nr:MAG: hypothetical protein M1836_001431 [Candelina mexicana]